MPVIHNNKLNVIWERHALTTQDAEIYHWTADDIKLLEKYRKDVDTNLEQSLGLSKNTISLLRLAFHKKLNRFTVWGVDLVSEHKQMFCDAAKLFKRGVATTVDEKSATVTGSYDMIFCRDDHFVFNAMKKNPFVVVDNNVVRSWPFIEEDVKLKIQDVGERRKDLELVSEVLNAWRSHGKPMTWMAVGGGLLLDVVAMAAGMVNAELTLVPTTLLAMADASVGGKTGVNFEDFGKNQLGNFYFPKEVIVWTSWLQTLKADEIKSGGAECLKHAILIGDKSLASKLSKSIKKNELDKIQEYLPSLVNHKKNVVREDTTERGVRATLNFGHTLAHALEARCHAHESKLYSIITHGAAVAIGMAFAAYISHKLYSLSIDDKNFIWQLLKESGCLPHREELEGFLVSDSLLDPALWKDLLYYMELDKKKTAVQDDCIDFVLLDKFGKVSRGKHGEYTILVPKKQLQEVWQSFVREFYW